MKVLVDKYEINEVTKLRTKAGREEVEAELLEDRGSTIVVRLPDGNVVTRKKERDLPKPKEA